jgi:hypothetical protein
MPRSPGTDGLAREVSGSTGGSDLGNNQPTEGLPLADGNDTDPTRVCPWCTATVTPDATRCPARGDAVAQRETIDGFAIPGMTIPDPALQAVDHGWRRRGMPRSFDRVVAYLDVTCHHAVTKRARRDAPAPLLDRWVLGLSKPERLVRVHGRAEGLVPQLGHALVSSPCSCPSRAFWAAKPPSGRRPSTMSLAQSGARTSCSCARGAGSAQTSPLTSTTPAGVCRRASILTCTPTTKPGR